MNFNRVVLSGHLTRDPELRQTSKGTAVCEFAIGINRMVGSRGPKKPETCFVDCIAWEKTGALIASRLKKGSPIFLEGRLTMERWTSKEGAPRSRLRVTVETFQFVTSGKDEDKEFVARDEPEEEPLF